MDPLRSLPIEPNKNNDPISIPPKKAFSLPKALSAPNTKRYINYTYDFSSHTRSRSISSYESTWNHKDNSAEKFFEDTSTDEALDYFIGKADNLLTSIQGTFKPQEVYKDYEFYFHPNITFDNLSIRQVTDSKIIIYEDHFTGIWNLSLGSWEIFSKLKQPIRDIVPLPNNELLLFPKGGHAISIWSSDLKVCKYPFPLKISLILDNIQGYQVIPLADNSTFLFWGNEGVIGYDKKTEAITFTYSIDDPCLQIQKPFLFKKNKYLIFNDKETFYALNTKTWTTKTLQTAKIAHPSGQFVIKDKTLVVWSKSKIWIYHKMKRAEHKPTLIKTDSLLKNLVPTQESSILAGLQENKVECWDLESKELLCTIKTPRHDHILAISNSDEILTWSSDGSISIWNAKTGTHCHTYTHSFRDPQSPYNYLRKVFLTDNAQHLISYDSTGTLSIRDFASGKIITTKQDTAYRGFHQPEKSQNLVAWSRLTLFSIDLNTGETMQTIRLKLPNTSPDRKIKTVQFSEFGVAALDSDGTVIGTILTVKNYIKPKPLLEF